MVMEIKLSNSDAVALVDEDLYEYLVCYKWYNRNGYAVRWLGKKEKEFYGTKTNHVLMHRQILGLINKPDIIVDHANHNGLDNQLRNIRECTFRENSRNTRKLTPKTSKYKGVYFYDGKWKSTIFIDKNVQIGSFDDEETAALAYDQIARIFQKNFAVLNIPEKNVNVVDVKGFLYKLNTSMEDRKTSKYIGVHCVDRECEKRICKWRVEIRVNGKKKHIGHFKDEDFAARVYDQFCRYYGNTNLNFPDENIDVIRIEDYIDNKNRTSSKYRGVSFSKVTGKWDTYVGKTRLGHHSTELEAAIVRDKYILDNNLDTKKYRLNFPGGLQEQPSSPS
jgi:hypothetical protein